MGIKIKITESLFLLIKWHLVLFTWNSFLLKPFIPNQMIDQLFVMNCIITSSFVLVLCRFDFRNARLCVWTTIDSFPSALSAFHHDNSLKSKLRKCIFVLKELGKIIINTGLKLEYTAYVQHLLTFFVQPILTKQF